METRQNKTICIPFCSEDQYRDCMRDAGLFRDYLMETYGQYPELFPASIKDGFKLHGFVNSKKQEIKMRRIRIKSNQEAYQIRPSFLMPYMVATTDEVEKALYLRRWGVPFEALAYVFGRDAMYWYRIYVSLGRNSIVGTTIKNPDYLPEDVAADEKHSWLREEKIFIPTTAADGCILGIDIAEDAGTKSLTEAYRNFKEEAQNLKPDYAPKTVNVDGWEQTQSAWKKLFPSITVILRYLHAVLKIRDRCRRCKEIYGLVKEKVWHPYKANTLAQFSQRIRRLREWAQSATILPATVKEKILALCGKASLFKVAYSFQFAYRTSNAVDRLMNYMARLLYAMQYFHGTKENARLYLRAMALIWNFHPYGARTRYKYPFCSSPFRDVNGFEYHQNWLHNLLIAASVGGGSVRLRV